VDEDAVMERETAELIAEEWAEVHQDKSSEAQNRAMKEELDAAPEPGGRGHEWAILDTGVELQPVGLIAENELYILEPEGSKDLIAMTRWPLSEVSVKDRETVHDSEQPDSAGGRRWTFDLGTGERTLAFTVKWMPPQDFNRSGSFADVLKAKIASADWL
jgi:hypothetical protein